MLRLSAIALATAGPVLCWSINALAQGPVLLTNSQLESVTAGAATVASSTDAQAAGVVALVNTTTNSTVTGGTAPYAGQPGLTNTVGATVGTALAVGTNLGQAGEPTPSSSTAVMTGGAADGNLVINSTYNHTVQGVGGVTFQLGYTFVSGSWFGL